MKDLKQSNLLKFALGVSYILYIVSVEFPNVQITLNKCYYLVLFYPALIKIGHVFLTLAWEFGWQIYKVLSL